MTNLELKEELSDEIMDEDVLDQMIVLEGDEFADGAVGYTEYGKRRKRTDHYARVR